MKLSQETHAILPLLMGEPTKSDYAKGYAEVKNCRVVLTPKGREYLAPKITLDLFPCDHNKPEDLEKAIYLTLIAYAGHDGGFYGKTRITHKEFLEALTSIDTIDDVKITESEWSSFEGTFAEQSGKKGIQISIDTEDEYYVFYVEIPSYVLLIRAMASELGFGEWVLSNSPSVSKSSSL